MKARTPSAYKQKKGSETDEKSALTYVVLKRKLSRGLVHRVARFMFKHNRTVAYFKTHRN
jgi:hypothetical protein